eukprot:6207253-Pleurochrysis_carterae.AAC.3
MQCRARAKSEVLFALVCALIARSNRNRRGEIRRFKAHQTGPYCGLMHYAVFRAAGIGTKRAAASHRV